MNSGLRVLTFAMFCTTLPGIDVEDARDYEDLVILTDDGAPTWQLQYGSFSYRSEADRLLEALAADGIEAQVYGQVIGDVGFFIVRGGEYLSREEGLRALHEIGERTERRPFLVTPGS